MENQLTVYLAEKCADERSQFEQALTQSCPIPVFYADGAGKWCCVNEPLCILLNTTAASLIGDGWMRFVPKDQMVSLGNSWHSMLKSTEPKTSFTGLLRPANGLPVKVFFSLVRVPFGGILGYVMPKCDNTETYCPVHDHLLKNKAAWL